MTDMIAVTYPNEDTAQKALAELHALHAEHTLHLTDVVLLTREERGAVKIHDEAHPIAVSAVDGALWGGLLGLLLLQPLLGAAIGAAVGGVTGAIADDSGQTQFIKKLGERLAPGHAAVIALIAGGTEDKALPRMAQYGGEILHTSLSQDDEIQLSRALQHIQPQATTD
jgi:uncharacterized membrane protein